MNFSELSELTGYNGLVNAMDDTTFNFIYNNERKTETPLNVISRTLTSTKVADLFFSDANIDILQEGLKNMVYNKTNGRYNIGKQNETELKIVMRSIYFQFAKNIPCNIMNQVKELNTRVINWCVPEIIANIELHNKFKEDITKLPVPLQRAEIMTLKGTKTLEYRY